MTNQFFDQGSSLDQAKQAFENRTNKGHTLGIWSTTGTDDF